MQFEYTHPQTELERFFGGFFSINAFGKIEAGDAEKFRTFLTKAEPPPRTTVYIDSSGGHVDEAMAIGRIIRDHWFATSIGRYVIAQQTDSVPIFPRELSPGRCLSAATLAFLGGRLRHLPSGSEFGVHQFSFRDPIPENIGRSQILSAKIGRYVAEMGLPPDFLELSASVPGTDMKIVDSDQLHALGVLTGGQTNVSWSIHALGGGLYVRGERDSIHGHHKVLLCYTKEGGFFFYGVIESQGREEELTNFGLVELVVNDEDIRLDISNRCERVVNGIYVNVFAPLSLEEARLIAYSESFGVQIRTSPDAEIFLGIAAMSTEGGKDQLVSFFHTLS